MAELYAKPYEVIDTGYNPQQTQQGGQDAEMQSYLESLPPEERQKAIERLNAPLTGEELALMAKSGQRKPTLEEFAEIEKFHKSHEVSFIEGLGKIAEGGEQVMTDLSNAFASFLDKPSDATSKMPATAVEAFAQGTRNFYGMLAQSQNTDSVLFRVKDFLNGTGTLEDRYNQYIDALEFNKQSADLVEGKQTLVMDKDMINHEVTQAMAYIADPTLFIPFGKVASTGLRAVGLGEKLTMAGARAAAIKNGIIGNTIKWGVGQPLEFMGGAVRNTIDYGLEKAGAAFEATTGISGKEFAQTARMSGVGFSASGIAGYAVPYASTVSDAYLVGSSAKGFGEALTLLGDTMKKNKFGRGINSWAAEALEQAEKNGVALSPHAKGLLKTLNAVDPLFAYGWNGLETAAEGAFIGGTLGYLSDNAEGMYSGIGAGIALGAVGGTAGKVVADITGGTNVARRAVQAKMVIEGHKATNPEKAMFFQAMQKAAEIRGQDVDLVNGIIAGIDRVAPNFEFHALTPDQFKDIAKERGYNPDTGKFVELNAIDAEFGGDRASRSKAMSILRSIGGEFAGDRKAFLDALKKASSKDSADPTKPASNIPLSFRKYIDVAKSFEKLTKTQQEAILKEIDGQGSIAKELGGKTKLRDHYATLTWAEAWTDQLVKKFESDREGARKDITEMLSQETDKNGKLTRKGLALADKLRAEGFLDRDNKLLRERNLLNADLTYSNFKNSKGAVIERQADGKTHMYINLATMGSETFPHELFHTIMRESPMKKHFTDTLVHKLLGTVDKDGNLVRPAEVNIGQIEKFFKKYIDLTHRNDDGTLNAQEADAKFRQVQDALTEYRNAGENKKISDDARSLLENYTEEFGAYYFSHWLMGRNRNTLFFGGELKGIEGLVERAKDSFKDFWQSKISKSNPEFDFSRGLNEAFDRSKGLGRIGAMDYFMRDMVRAASNANKEVFRPDSMTLENLRDFERSNGLRNLTAQGGTRRLNPREQVTQNIRLGKEAYKILSGLDKNLRTSKDVLDENGKQIITGRLSEAELDALVKGGIVPRAWADKVNQGYAMLDGTVSNIFSAGYLGRTEQTTDASYPRLTGKDVSFKNRKAVLFDVETKIKADGTFYTLFHTLDLAVIEQRANHLWQNVDYRNLWNGDRAAFEADFFRYISNASKASTDPKKLDSATLFETGDGNGAKRRDVMHQMAGMALQTGDAYKHQPIAVIPEGIRHSVTTFNIDGMTMPRVETGTRYDINMGNAHKFIRENWQPAEMKQEKTPSGTLMRHESGFKFSVANGKTTAFTSAGKKIGTFDSIKQATEAAKREYHKVYDNIDKAVRESVAEQDKNATKFQPLDENERAEAIRLGDVFALQSMKDFVGNRTLLRQTREEHIYQRALEAIENPEQLLAYAEQKAQNSLNIKSKYDAMFKELEKRQASYNSVKDNNFKIHDQQLGVLRKKHGVVDTFEDWKETSEKYNPPSYSDKDGLLEYYKTKEERKTYDRSAFYRYEQDAKIAWDKYFADPAHAKEMQRYESVKETLSKEWTDLLTFEESLTQFKKANAEAMNDPIVSYLDTLGQYSTAETTRAEKATMFAKSVEANAKQKDYSGLLEALFASEYDDKIQTGKPFVAVTTHGTGNVELMLARLFAADKLGSHYDIPSSRMGSFSAGSQNTSRAYARKPQVVDRSPAGRFKRLTSFLNEEGKTDKTTEQYKLTQKYIDLHRGYLKRLGYDEGTIDILWRGFLHEKDPHKQSLTQERFPQEVRDTWEVLVKKDDENLPPVAPDRHMQLRKVIRMDNPYVVVDPRSYEEHYISPHMKRAIAAGHDGIIFKRFADGGQPDNVYVVFKDYMKDNIKVIDTSFDDVQVPRGNDETGRVLKGGKELNLAFQPTEIPEKRGTVKIKEGYTRVYHQTTADNIESIKRNGLLVSKSRPSSESRGVSVSETPFYGNNPDLVTIELQVPTEKLKQANGSALLEDVPASNIIAVHEDWHDKARYILNNPSSLKEVLNGDMDFFLGDGSPEAKAIEYIKNKYKNNRANLQPTEGEQGGRVYDTKGIEFRTKFIGKQAEENPDRIKNKNIEFLRRKDGSYRITMSDNTDTTKKVGHITATIDDSSMVAGEGAAELSTNIDSKYRGNKLANILYSEMAERLRAMGIKYVDGTIVNKDGIPVQVRNTVIGQTYYKGSNKPAFREDAAKQIQAVQSIYPSKGIGVYNELDFNARYQPTEGDDYRGTHKAPSGENGEGSLDAMDRTYPEDLYSAQGARFYGSGFETDKKMHELIIKFRGKPDAMVTVYRAVPKGIDASINKGDWVTPLREYAVLHGNRWEQGMTILEKKVKASELFTEGNSIYEFGWNPKEITKADALRKEIADHEKFMERSRNNAPILWERKGTKIYAQREAMERRLSSLKYELKNIEQENNRPKFQPVEGKIPTRDEGFNRVYREISRNKKASARSIKQAYLDKWGIDLNDYERYKQLEDAVHDLEFRRNNNEYEGTEREYNDERQELLNEYNELESAMTDQITGIQGDYAHRFNDQEGEITSGIKSIERIIDDISKVPLDTVDTFSGKNRLDALLKRRLGSGFAQEITGDNVFIADAFREYAGIKYEREMLGKAFESELYSSSDYYSEDKKGILIDILRSENKLTDKGLPQGEVNPRRIINALRNKSGGDSKVYAEAKAIGLIDWLESKQEGKNQKKVTTKELIEFVENNKMGLEIDPQLEQNADFGSTRPYVTGGEEQAKKGYRVYVVRMTNAKHEHGVAGHFEGAVVHVRVTLRDTKDGKKVMHIEEIQANNTATDVLSDAQRKMVTEEIKLLYKYRDAREKILNEGSSEVRTINSWNVSSAERTIAHDDMVKRQTSKLDKLRAESAEKLFDANPEYWKDKFSSNTQRDRDGYIKLVDKYLLSNRESILISEKETSLNNSKNNAPLQDPKEWVKVAFRTVLRKALVEGVDRITITPWSETPLQVGMKVKSAERFYGKTIVDAFNSELQKMNSRLSSTNSSESIPRQRYNDSKLKTNEAIQKVSKAVVPSELTGTKAKELFEVLHKDDADIASNHTPNALESRFSYLLGTIPDGTSGKWEMTTAAQRRLNQFRDYTIMLESQDGGKHPSGLSKKASAASMSESQYLVDRSMGFDLTPEMKKKAARPQRMFQPAEYTEFKSEQSATGRLLRNAKGYVIMLANNKFRVYNPAKAILGVYGSEEEAKKRIYREIPKQ